MICVKIELWPHGVESRAREIGRTYIANDGAGTIDRGDYKVAVCKRGTTEVPREIYSDGDLVTDEALRELGRKPPPKATRAGEVKDYPRQAYNVWRLIARAILSAFPEEDAQPKKRGNVLDALAVRGLHLIRDAWKDANGLVFDRQAVTAAQEWLDAAKREEN